MTTFLLHLSNRLETLAEVLSRVVAAPRDPMEPETILIQSGGMQRWVSMQLAQKHGICANATFPFPVAFAYSLCRTLLPDLPRDYPLSKERMLWSIVRLLPGLLHESEFASLRRYVAEDTGLKLVQLAERIAYHFDQYLIFRPTWAAQWQNNMPSGDFRLPGHLATEAWQARLWRELVRDMGDQHRAALLERAIATLNRAATPRGLPSRLCVFGIPTLPPIYLDLLNALARHSQVHVFLLSPCRQYWGDLSSHRERRRLYRSGSLEGKERPEDTTPLAGLGAVGRDFLELLWERDVLETRIHEEPDSPTMLGRLQLDLLDLNLDGDKCDFTDQSIQVHCCHSPWREMEVLKDLILDLLSADPTLTPQDILVMNPDIETYAPVIQAVFGAAPGEGIPFSISDRKPTRAAEIIPLFLELLEFGLHRFEASRVCRLLEAPPIRQRLDLDAAQTERVLEWISQSGVRWGLDRDFRRETGLGDHGQNTWASGLGRLFLGYMTGQSEPVEGIAPLALTSAAEQELLGRIALWIDTLGQLRRTLGAARTATDWSGCLLWTLDTFFPQDRLVADHLLLIRRTIGDLTRDMGNFEADLRTMLYLLGRRLDETGVESGFLASGLTFCGLRPMRSIPFRVICLTGLTSTAFPRQDITPGFDLMAARPRPGDRSLREDDRYLFLESIISARDALILTYPGLSQTDNAEAPPSVLVAELLDFLDQRYAHEGATPSETLVFRHKLQAFHPDYFTPGSSLFSYSRQNRDAARALFREPEPRLFFPPAAPAEASNLPAATDIDVNDLIRFLSHPCRYLLRSRHIDPAVGEAGFPDEEPLAAPSGLDLYGPVQTLLETALDQPDAGLGERLLAWQILPPGQAGTDAARTLCLQVRTLAEQIRQFTRGVLPTRRTLDLSLGPLRLSGDILLYDHHLVTCRPAKIKSSDMLRLWVSHLALLAAGHAVESVHIGRDGLFTAQAPQDPTEQLARLLDLYLRGKERPLPFFPRASLAFARARFTGRTPKERPQALAAALAQWEGGFNISPEKDDPCLAFLYRDTEPDWEDFAQVAEDVYRPILGENP